MMGKSKRIDRQMALRKVISGRFMEIMDREDLSMRQFALNAGLTPSSVIVWVEGEHLPSLEALVQIAQVYNVSMDWLVGRG